LGEKLRQEKLEVEGKLNFRVIVHRGGIDILRHAFTEGQYKDLSFFLSKFLSVFD
jgi:hypothetical protein